MYYYATRAQCRQSLNIFIVIKVSLLIQRHHCHSDTLWTVHNKIEKFSFKWQSEYNEFCHTHQINFQNPRSFYRFYFILFFRRKFAFLQRKINFELVSLLRTSSAICWLTKPTLRTQFIKSIKSIDYFDTAITFRYAHKYTEAAAAGIHGAATTTRSKKKTEKAK